MNTIWFGYSSQYVIRCSQFLSHITMRIHIFAQTTRSHVLGRFAVVTSWRFISYRSATNNNVIQYMRSFYFFVYNENKLVRERIRDNIQLYHSLFWKLSQFIIILLLMVWFLTFLFEVGIYAKNEKKSILCWWCWYFSINFCCFWLNGRVYHKKCEVYVNIFFSIPCLRVHRILIFEHT